jgi:single-strand DNA-binding protein
MPLNKVFIQGNITRDPKLEKLPKGTAVLNLSIANNRKWKTESGEQREAVYFAECKAFGTTAETINKFFRKGSPILVEGRLTREEWDDKQTGAKRHETRIVVESFQFCGDTGKNSSNESPAPKRDSSPPEANKTAGDLGGEGDDVPF